MWQDHMTTELHKLSFVYESYCTHTRRVFSGCRKQSSVLSGPHTPQAAATNREQHEKHELWNSL